MKCTEKECNSEATHDDLCTAHYVKKCQTDFAKALFRVLQCFSEEQFVRMEQPGGLIDLGTFGAGNGANWDVLIRRIPLN